MVGIDRLECPRHRHFQRREGGVRFDWEGRQEMTTRQKQTSNANEGEHSAI